MGGFNVTCVANCVSAGCANSQFFVNQVLNCAVGAIPQCIGMGGGGIVGCLMKQCSSQLAACIGSSCQ
jgi:hypothetical protein